MSLLAAVQIFLALAFLELCAAAQREPFGKGCCMLAAWLQGAFPLLPASVELLPWTSKHCSFQLGGTLICATLSRALVTGKFIYNPSENISVGRAAEGIGHGRRERQGTA